MNRKLLEKIKQAITDGKTDYAMGILDTLVESLPEETFKGFDNLPSPERMPYLDKVTFTPKETVSDEGSSLDMQARAKMGNIAMSAIKTE